MKKIIHFSLANAKGGITQYVLNNWDHIDKSRFRFDVVTFGGKLDFQEEIEAEGCKVFYVKHRAEDNLDGFRNAILHILRSGYDVIHLHTSYWKSFELERLAKRAGIPQIIIHSHNTAVFDDDEREKKEKRHYMLRDIVDADMATDYCACSKTAAEWLYADKIPPEKIHILKNSIDIEQFVYDEQVRKIYRARLKWEDKFIIGHIGRFSYQKNHVFLIELFKKIADVNEKARLLLIGKGPLEEQIKSMVRAYGLSDKVYFAGACNDVNCWIQSMDIFCLPSRFEGFPIVAVEAQAAGITSIFSSTITDEVKLTKNVVFLPLDQNEWKKEIEIKMNQMLTSSFLEKANNGEILRRQGYDIRDSVKELERLYDENIID